ncbi:MAG: hypothetical protein LBN20_05815 [Endomicrobium sp.]|jgi:hypothetical protein|nr:hypothetical protein [Endomicrobium sp.]
MKQCLLVIMLFCLFGCGREIIVSDHVYLPKKSPTMRDGIYVMNHDQGKAREELYGWGVYEKGSRVPLTNEEALKAAQDSHAEYYLVVKGSTTKINQDEYVKYLELVKKTNEQWRKKVDDYLAFINEAMRQNYLRRRNAERKLRNHFISIIND